MLDQWLSDNYEKLVEAAEKNSNSAEYSKDMLGIVFKDLYRQIENPKYADRFINLIKTGKILGIIIGALKNQIQSNTSEGYRSLRRNLQKKQLSGYIQYVNSGYTIDEHIDFEEKLETINSYLHLFHQIDVIIYKEVLLNNKSAKTVCEEYKISTNYIYKALNYINKGLKIYIECAGLSQYKTYIKSTQVWSQYKDCKILDYTKKQELFCYYNILTKFEDPAINVYNKSLINKVLNWYTEYIILD